MSTHSISNVILILAIRRLILLTLIFSAREVIISWLSELRAFGRLSLYTLAPPDDSYKIEASVGEDDEPGAEPASSFFGAADMGLEEMCRETVWSRVAADRVGSDIRMNGRTSDGITFGRDDSIRPLSYGSVI